EITQETFLRAHRKLSSLEDPAKLSPWLYRIATNLSYDWLRRSSRQPHLDSLSEPAAVAAEPDDRGPRLDQLIEQREMGSCVREYVESLPDSYRAVILLHDLEGLTNPEIAELLGISLATAKIRLHRARRRLREALGQGCSFSRDERDVLVCEPNDPSPGSGSP
ncbi:MAG: RNA polymerase sigma factor, partial [Thermoanaerobaculia bacterium]